MGVSVRKRFSGMTESGRWKPGGLKFEHFHEPLRRCPSTNEVAAL